MAYPARSTLASRRSSKLARLLATATPSDSTASGQTLKPWTKRFKCRHANENSSQVSLQPVLPVSRTTSQQPVATSQQPVATSQQPKLKYL